VARGLMMERLGNVPHALRATAGAQHHSTACRRDGWALTANFNLSQRGHSNGSTVV